MERTGDYKNRSEPGPVVDTINYVVIIINSVNRNVNQRREWIMKLTNVQNGLSGDPHTPMPGFDADDCLEPGGMRRILIIDTGRCSECMGCVEVAPEIFHYNEATGRMEVIDLQHYSDEIVWEAMKNCPKDCIYWEDILE